MSWWAIEARPPVEVREALAQWLVRESGQAVHERDDGIVVGYALEEDAARALARRMTDTFERIAPPVLAPVPTEDWSVRWREGIGCRVVGGLTIGPSWLLEPGPDRVVIDPEMAFGTGEHGSTRGVLALLVRQLRPGARVLDVGSGSAILGIAASKLGAVRVIGIEVDVEADPIARANLERNGVAATVHLLTGDATTLAPLLGPVDLILSNILRGINTALLPSFATTLAAEGVVIFGGMETPERLEFLAALEGGGFVPVDEAEDAGWWAVAARRR